MDISKKISSFSDRKGPVVVLILDGMGIGKKDKGDAYFAAGPENLEEYKRYAQEKNLYCQLKAHGLAVGLPTDEDMGNSEVGHNAIGAGQIYSQGARRINEAFDSSEIKKTEAWKKIVVNCAKKDKTIHLLGLLSDGNVHSHIKQIFRLLDEIISSGAKKIRLHPLLDGRDVAPDSGLFYVAMLEEKLGELEKRGISAKIASGGGRMWVTMDRYNSDWNVVKRGFYAHAHGKILDEELVNGYRGYYSSAKEAIEEARQIFPEKLDQFNPPFVIVDENGHPVGKMEDGDSVINFNFRGDRAIQISRAFIEEDFQPFDRLNPPKINYAGLLEYDSEAHMPPYYLVPPPSIKNTSSEFICSAGIPSCAIAETHKFGHVTYFWNGNKSGFINPKLEVYEEIKSLPNETIEKQPEMRIYQACERMIAAIASGKYGYIRGNFANGDMVGHTGNMDSCIKAVKAVDECVKKVVDETMKRNGVILITADHGNVEEMLDKKGKTMTSHTLNPVPCFILDSIKDPAYKISLEGIEVPGIANITASFMDLLGISAPDFYEKSLLVKK